jgi:hypothetical protein
MYQHIDATNVSECSLPEGRAYTTNLSASNGVAFPYNVNGKSKLFLRSS